MAKTPLELRAGVTLANQHCSLISDADLPHHSSKPTTADEPPELVQPIQEEPELAGSTMVWIKMDSTCKNFSICLWGRSPGRSYTLCRTSDGFRHPQSIEASPVVKLWARIFASPPYYFLFYGYCSKTKPRSTPPTMSGNASWRGLPESWNRRWAMHWQSMCNQHQLHRHVYRSFMQRARLQQTFLLEPISNLKLIRPLNMLLRTYLEKLRRAFISLSYSPFLV